MFGLNCAPEIFQKLMGRILAGCDGCLHFIDDIIVFGANEREHEERLKKVLKRLSEFNVTLNKKKCQFAVSEVDFLGHHLSSNGITASFDKVESVRQFRAPKNSDEVRSFLGLVNYMGKFIPNLATVSEPLRKLTRFNTNFQWTKEQEDSFLNLKACLLDQSTLGYYDVEDRTRVIADASPVGLGAVLVQFGLNGPRVIAYASRSLSKTEQKYAQTEKEALALVWAVEKYRYYLFGKEFELVTDHRPLEVLFGAKSRPCARIERWVMRLMSFKYKIIYQPGKTNIADPFSRLSITESAEKVQSDSDSDNYVQWVLSHSEPKAIKLCEIEEASATDKTILAVKRAIYENVWAEDAKPFKFVETELCFFGNILLRGTRLVIPSNLRERTLTLAHEGHPAKTKMKRRLRAKIWWPKLDFDVDAFVDRCRGCTLISIPPPAEPMHRKKLPDGPWQDLAMDFCGPLPSGHHLFVVVDYYSRFIEVEPMKSIDSFKTIKKLEVMFARFGLPRSIQTDNGPQFVSAEFKQYCTTNNIELNTTIPYWPQMNGEVERQNRSLLDRLRISQENGDDWQEDLTKYLMMYRSTEHMTTLKSPAELMFRRPFRDKLPTITQPMERDEEVEDKDSENKQKGKEYSDRTRHAMQSDIKEGDRVYQKRQVKINKLSTNYEPTKFLVLKRTGSDVLVENPVAKTQYRRNVAHLRKVESDHRNSPFSFAEHSPSPILPNASSTQACVPSASRDAVPSTSTSTPPVTTSTKESTNLHSGSPNRKRLQEPLEHLRRKIIKPSRYRD